MAEIKSVHFSPILEHISDDTSLVSTDISLFTEGMNFEEAHVASFSEIAKKYRVPHEDKGEPRRPRTRKIALLVLGFIFLLGVAGVVIYLITQKLYNRDGYTYSGNVGEKKTGFPSRNATLQEYTSRLVAVSTTKPSSETSKEHITVYSTKGTIYPPTITVHESSSLVTGSGSTKQNATSTSSFSTQLSRKVASPSLVRQDSNSLLKTSGIKKHWHNTHSFKRHETSSKKKNTAYTESAWSTASLQSVTASTSSFDEIKAKMSYSLKEKANFVTTTSPLAQSSTKFLKNVETIIRRLNSSSKHTWLPSGTEMREFPNTKNFTSRSAGENTKFKQTTKQKGQSLLGITSFLSVTPSKLPFSSQNISEKSNEMHTRGAAIKTEMMSMTHLRTTRSNIILSDRHSISTVINTLTENVKVSNFNRNMMTSSSDQNVSSNNTLLFSPSQWPTWMQQISSSSYYRVGASSIQVSMIPKVSSTTSALYVSSKFLDKHTDTSQSVISNQLLSVLKLSATKFVTPTEKPSSTRTQDSLSVVVSSPLLLSTLKRRSSTVEEIQTLKSIMTNSASVHPTSHTIASNTVTLTQPRNSSTGGFVEYKSMVSLSVTQTLSPYITHDGLSPIKDKVFSQTGQKSSKLIITKTSLNTISKPVFQTDAIAVLKPTPTASIGSSPVKFDDLPISYVSYHSSFGNSKTVTSKATSSNTHLPQSISTLDSKSTLQAVASLSIVEPASTLQLGSREVPVITSFFPHLKSVESIKGSLSRHETPFAFQTTFSYTLHNGSIDTRAHSTATSTVIITVMPSSVSLFFLTTTIMASRKTTSKVLTVGIPVVTSSIQHLRSTESIQGSLLSSVSTKAFHYTLSSSQTLTNLTITRIYFTTESPVVKSTALSTGLLSSAINNSIEVSSNISVKGSSLTTYLPQLKTVNSTTSALGVFALNSAFATHAHLTHSEDTVFYRVSSVQATMKPIMNPTSNSSTPFKIMDGSLIIRNKNYHTNLSNPNSTMFIILADEVETIIMNIVSLNNTFVMDVEVTSFRNGSVIADFNLRVRYHSSFTDQQFAQLLSEANETLWRGYHVTNITVTLRTIKEGSSEPSHGQDDTGLSKTAIIAILTVIAALLLTVVGFGVYYCKKKGMCHMSKVKPADSPIPPSELEKVQPVRRGTWVMNDQPFIKVDVPTDSNYETLSMKVLEKKETDLKERVDPDLLRESTKSPFEPNYENTDVVDDSTNHGPHPSTSRSISNPNLIDSVDRPISGSSQSTNLNITSNSEEDHEC